MTATAPEFVSPGSPEFDWNSKAEPTTEFSKPASGSFTQRARELAAGKRASGTAPKAGSKRPTKPKVTEPPSKPGEFTEDIEAFYTMIGMVVAAKDQHCGVAIVQSAPKIAESWDKLAESNPAVRKALRSLTQVSAFGTVMAAHMPVIMAISAHHGVGFGPRPTVEDIETEGDND